MQGFEQNTGGMCVCVCVCGCMSLLGGMRGIMLLGLGQGGG